MISELLISFENVKTMYFFKNTVTEKSTLKEIN